MSYYDAIERGLKRRKEKEWMTTVSATDGGFSGAIARGLQRKHEREALRESDYFATVGMDDEDEDIAPVKGGLDFFQKGAFEDGFDWSDIPSVILGTAGDVGLNLAKGAGGMLEGIVDAANYGIAGVADAVGKDDFAARIRKNTQKSAIDEWTKGADDYLNQYSVLGKTSDAIVQGLGQAGTILLTGGVGSAAGLGTAGVTAMTTGAMGISGLGSGMGEAYQNGASDLEALKHGLNTGAADALSELIFGGLGKSINALGISRGLSSADDMLAKLVGSKFKNQMAKNLVEFGIKAGAEGLEEVIAGVAQAYSKHNTYLKDQGVEFQDVLKDENLLEQFVVGAFTSGIAQTSGLHIANKTGTDFVTGMSQNEQAVAKKEIENRIAEAEKDGKKLTAKEKSAIETQVERDLEKGYISTDTIEEVLGGETYKAYKDTIESEDSLLQEFDTLYKMKQSDMTGEQIDRLAQLKPQAEEIRKNNKRDQLKTQLGEEVFNLAKGDRLAESYNERSRKGQAFEADLTKYDEKQKAVIQKAIDSGILNNTNRTHEFVDLVAKISADKGVAFDFTNNEKLKTSGFALEGKTINGYVTKDGISINIQSSKSLNTVVGHEITHVLEGTELYTELQKAVVDYAKAKGDFQGRYDSLAKLYEGVEGADIDAELTADLVGDYLFTDADFVNRLSTENRNVFQKVFDEIKYLCRVATAGSKEARQLERVKRVFEEAYRENVKNTAEDGGVKYSVTDEQNENGLDTTSEVHFSLSRDTEYMDKAISMNQASLLVDGRVMGEAKAVRERTAERMNAIKDRGLVALPEDIEGNTYIANSSYDGTEENTTICPRSLASEAFVDAVSEYLGRPLTVEEQIYISQDLQGRSMTPECTYCYVATDRKAYRAFLGEYVKQRDAVIQKVSENPNADVSRSGELYKEFLNGRKDTNPMYSRFKMWVDAYKNGKPMVDASHLANINKLMGDINSEFGAELKSQIVDAMKYAQSASWAKKRVNYVAYNGHILKWKQDRINKLNSHYGLRMYSFSDFHPAFVLENMQMITDAAVRGLKMLGYTKDTDFVEIFAPSGMNINISTFGFETDGSVYENNIIGAEWAKAKELREQYPNVGITFVATNDTLVNWALEQDWIDVVIPYHLVRTGTEVAKAFGYTNYTSESSDTKRRDWKKGDKKFIAPTDHNNDVETYFKALEENNLNPRFERFKDHPNYMKLVNECRQSASDSKPVQPVFNENAAMIALAKLEANGYYQPIGGSMDRMYEIAAEVAENMQKEIAPIYSLSDSDAKHPAYGNYNVYGEDVALELGPVRSDLNDLIVQRNDIRSAMEAAAAIGDTKTLTELTQEFVGLQSRIGELEAQNVDAPVKSEPAPAAVMENADDPVKRITRKQLHQNILTDIKGKFAERGFDFDVVLKNAKNLSTFATVDNTPQRVMEKSLGYKEGGILSDLTVNKVAQNETEGIKWLNSFTDRKNGILAQISRKYNIKPGSKKSAAAQMYAEGFYVDEKNNIVQYGDAELAADFPDVKVQRQIKGLANDSRIRKIYDDTLKAINESRTRNAYPEIPRLENYFLHFRAMEDTFSRLGLPFNPNDIRAKDLPTDLNGVTADLKPGQPYFASAMHRTGKRTSFDLLGGLEKYLTSAKNQIYHIDDIQTLRALRNYVAETYGQASGLENLDSLTDAEAEERIEQVYNSHLSTFAKFLNEEANILAGKTALIDRGLEGVIGRRGITFLNTVNGQVGKNMVGFNLSSSLTNFVPVAQTFAKTNKADFVKAFSQTVANKIGSVFGRNDGFADNSPVIIRRKGADSFYRTLYQKIGDVGYVLMSAVDDISTELIARTKYNEFTRKGMDSQKAHYETDKWVSRLMGDRSLGQQPQLYNSKMLGLVTKFQLEVRNQLDSQFYDTIQEAKVSTEDIQNGIARNAMKAAKIASTFTQLAVVQHLFGTAFESVAGYNPAFDIIEVLMTACGWDDDEESEDTVLDNIEQGFLALLEDLPYASTLTGGRIPIESALPIAEFVKGEDAYGNEKSRWETVAEVAPYYLLPGGYGQIKKTRAGLDMFSDDHPIAGSYTNAGKLRFPVEDTLGNRVQAAVFGQYASGNARDYFDNDRSALTDTQLAEFMELDAPIQDYWEYRDGLKALSKQAEDRGETLKQADKLKYINGLDLTKKQKDVLKSYLFDEDGYKKDNPGKYAFLEKEGIGYLGYKQLDEDTQEAWSWAYSHQDEYRFYKENGVLPEDYSVYRIPMLDFKDESNEAYQWAFDNPEKATFGKVFSDGVREYRKYTAALSTIHADKDSNGKAINGSAKQKKLDYINSLDIDYGEKLILYKNEYNADDTFNEEIVEYLNGRMDISFEEEIAILRELGFTVTDDGVITLD